MGWIVSANVEFGTNCEKGNDEEYKNSDAKIIQELERK